jgi:hypothetical protein
MAQSQPKGVRTDLMIALFALLISTLTASAAIYQGRVISNQLSVTVWPYLSYKTTASNTGIQLDVENVGVGPAIVRSATLFIDGKPQPSLTSALRQLGYVSKHGSSAGLSSLGAGEVIRAGEAVTLARVQSAAFAARAAELQTRVRLETCYCSLLDQCWLAKSGADSPVGVRNCDAYANASISP